MNAYRSGPNNATDSTLTAILEQMITDIEDQQCHYWLYSNYFEILPDNPPQPPERTATRRYMSPLFLDWDSVWNVAFEEDGVSMDVILKNQLPAVRERIGIDYAQIYFVKRFHADEQPRSEADYLLYHDTGKLQMPSIN